MPGLVLRTKAANGEPLILRPVQTADTDLLTEDAALLAEWRNRNQQFFLSQFPATPESTRRWLTGWVATTDASRTLFMVHEAGGPAFGHVGLRSLSPQDRSGELDNVLRGAACPRGSMLAAVSALLDWAKETLMLRQFWLRVFADNPAVGFYKRAGFETVRDVPVTCVLSSDGIYRWVELDAADLRPHEASGARRLQYMRLAQAASSQDDPH